MDTHQQQTDGRVMAKFTGQGGYPGDRKRADGALVVGALYEIVGGRVDRWSTDLELRHVPGRWNSVMFDYDEGAAAPLLDNLYMDVDI